MSFFNRTFKIGDRVVGDGCPVFVIAEAGVAHFGSMDKAYALVDMAKKAGADAVKFQIFDTDELISPVSKEWQDRLRPRELPYESFAEIKRHCDNTDIMFLATAHDEKSLEFLESLDVPAYKIGSGEVKNWPFFRKIALKNKPIIFSTGMFSETEINDALSTIQACGNKDIAILHCVTSYPTDPENVNLLSIPYIDNTFDVVTGYSDHTAGFHFPLAAVSLGAQVVEKHISLDFNIPNAQDWKVSCDSESLVEMIRQIRDIESGLGTETVKVSHQEKNSIDWARKSIVVSRDIEKGIYLTEDMLTTKRPGTGIPPSEITKIIGKETILPLKKDMLLEWSHLK